MRDRSHGSLLPTLPQQLRLLRTSAAAQLLGLSKSTLEKWRLAGDGPPFVKLGGAVAYRLSDLEAWIESRVVNQSIAVGVSAVVNSGSSDIQLGVGPCVKRLGGTEPRP